jgi:hypothetical protein
MARPLAAIGRNFLRGAVFFIQHHHNMNTSSLPILSFLAVLTASILLPVSAGAACIALTITGVAAVLASDYGRDSAPIQSAANVIPVDFSSRHAAGLGRAA